MLLIREGFYPRTHFHVTQTGSGHFPVNITITTALSAEQEARLRAGIATILSASIQ